jgi:O-methyltransferase
MNLSIFQVVNYTLILALLILLLRYLWITFTGLDRKPVQWQFALKNRLVPERLRRLEKAYPDKVRFFNWWLQTGRMTAEKVPGVFVELGVYKGESAGILHQMDPDRPFHLFDTFTGFTPGDLDIETGEAATYTPDNFADTSVEMVLKKINGNNNIIIHKGYFPESARDFHHQVALLNMDADLYKPTRSGLELFYPLMAPGGIILVHDYNHKWPGIIKAVDGFVKTIPENMILLPDINGTAMIIRGK